MLAKKSIFNWETTSELLRLALPMVVSQGAFAVMIFTDRYFLSQVSPLHMAAALGGGVAAYFSFCFFSGVVTYANALAAQYLGALEKHKCPKVVTQGMVIAILSMPPLLLITYFVADIFAAMGHPPEQVELERIYFLILMAGVLVTLAKMCLSAYFAGIGRSRIVMLCDIGGLIVNVPLCYGMVFGRWGLPELGIVGAAISTLIATAFSLLMFLYYYFEKDHREEFRVLESLRFDAGIFRRFLRLGSPSGLELFLNVAAFNLFLLMFQGYGVAEGASAAIVFNWDILSFVPMMGLNIGVISMIGRFVGAGDMGRANEVISAGFLLAYGYSGALALLFILLRFPMVEVFAPPAGDFSEIRALASYMMIGLATYTMADATILVAGGALRGAGDTRWMMVTSIILHWGMLVAQYFIIRVYDLGPRVSWVAFCVMILAIAAVFAKRLHGGRWRDPEVLRAVMAET